MKQFKKFWSDESGSPIVEFVIVAPLFFMFFFWVFELGIMTVRWAMLDRGLDLTIRGLRVGEYINDLTADNVANHDFLRREVCENSGVLKNCETLLYLELTVLAAGENIPSDGAACVNRTAPTNTRPDVNSGDRTEQETQQIVYVRACYWVDPVMPFGMRLLGASSETKNPNAPTANKVYDNGFAITAKTIYINEPNSG